GFLLKDAPPAQIAEAIRRVAAGDPILSPAVTRRLMRRAVVQENTKEQALRQLAGLSPREREVVEAIAGGQTNAEIAASLLMSVPTVKAHVTHILTKASLANRTQIALLAHDAGLAGINPYGDLDPIDLTAVSERDFDGEDLLCDSHLYP